MNARMKKCLSLLLCLVMLLGVAVFPAEAADDAGTVYLSFALTSDEAGKTVIDSAKMGDTVYIQVNFANNPTDKAQTVTNYDLCVGYNSSLFTACSVLNDDTAFTGNPNFADGVVYAGWSDPQNGIHNDDEILASGRLFCIQCTAKTGLSADDFEEAAASIKLLSEATGKREQITQMQTISGKNFELVEAPVLSATVDGGIIYDSDTAEEVKRHITATYLDVTGEKITLGADDLTVTLPQDGLKAGENTVTVRAKGQKTTVSLTVTADTVSAIAITRQPSKTVYTSGETFDMTGMVVTATYASGKTKNVTSDCTFDKTTLKTTDTSVTVSYDGQTEEQAITVNQKEIKVPAASGTYTYNGSKQTLALTDDEDAAYYTVTDNEQTNAGNYTATVTLKDITETKWATEFDGEISWAIAPKEVSNLIITVDPDAADYTGSAITPTTVTVTDGTTTLIEGENNDYTVTYSNNTKVGEATVTITGKGNYSGEQTATFTINAKSISDSTVTVASIDDQTYTGSAIEPAVTVTDGETPLVEDTDYTVSYSKNTNAGEATVTITGKGNYSGERTASFTINAKSIESATVAAIASQTYTGSAIEPAVTVTDGEKTLIKDTDYTVSYSEDHTKVGTVTVTVTGMGNYKDTTSTTFTISKVSAPITVTANSATKTYDGTALTDSGFTYTDGVLVAGDTLTATVEGSITNVGTADNVVKSYQVINAAGTDVTYCYNFGTSVKGTLTVSKKTVGLTWSGFENLTYDGTAKNVTATATGLATGDTCAVTVENGSQKDAGNYSVTASGLSNSNYQLPDAVTKAYTIAQAEITVSGISAVGRVYNGEKTVALNFDNVKFTGLVTGDSLTVTATGTMSDADAGEDKNVTISGLTLDGTSVANYRLAESGNQTSTTVTIAKKAAEALTLTVASATYTGKAYDAENLIPSRNANDVTYTYYADKNGEKGDAMSGAPTAVGTYWVVGTIAESQNTAAATSEPVQFEITPVTAVITVEDGSLVASAKNEALMLILAAYDKEGKLIATRTGGSRVSMTLSEDIYSAKAFAVTDTGFAPCLQVAVWQK